MLFCTQRLSHQHLAGVGEAQANHNGKIDHLTALGYCGEDRVTKMIMTDKVFRALMRIRDSGATNMFDTGMVQRLAYDAGEYELVMYIEEHRKEYAHFIMTGRER